MLSMILVHVNATYYVIYIYIDIYILAKKRVLMYYPLQGVSMFFLIKMVHPV